MARYERKTGITKGIVVDTNDPAGYNRIKVRIPELHGIMDKNKQELRKEQRVYAILLIACVVLLFPLWKWCGIPGIVIWGLLFAAALFYAVKLEKVKKQHDIHTYKEIVAFTNGEKLDNIEKAREEGKRNYQLIIAVVACAALGLGVAWIVFH